MSRLDTASLDEASRIADVAQRLMERFPQVPPNRVSVVVQDAHAEFIDAAVRDFVPVLVEKRAREILDLENRTRVHLP